MEDSNLDQQYIDRIQEVSFNPIFIMGVQRSGTSILYKLLSKTNSFNIIKAYHIIKNKELIHNHINKLEEKSKKELADFFKNKSQMNRGVDKLQITPDFPEEYGFVLAQKTGKSQITHESIKTFNEFCKKIQYISENSKSILLKNPFDFSNFVFIKENIPNAKFIFIHRTPIKTLNSQINSLRTLLKQKSEYMALLSPSYDKMFSNKILYNYYKFIYTSLAPITINKAIRNLANRTKYFLENIESIEKNDYVTTRYEDICEEPNEEIKKIMNFLNIKLESSADFSTFIKPRKTNILKELKNQEKYIFKTMEPYLKYCGYL
jgi:hypothetical protein